jgi:hypothetical protein
MMIKPEKTGNRRFNRNGSTGFVVIQDKTKNIQVGIDYDGTGNKELTHPNLARRRS